MIDYHHTPEQAAILALLDRVEALERQVERLTSQVDPRAEQLTRATATRVLTAIPPKGWKREARP